jgi:microcystin-dependent protein
MAEAFIGEIQIYAFDQRFGPRGWAQCNGQVLPIAQNQALFSLLGTMYGGNGTTNFALPDMRSRIPIHPGQGSGLSAYTQGQKAGVENVTLATNQIPAHNHTLGVVVNTVADQSNPVGNRLGVVPVGIGDVYGGAGATTGAAALPSQGGGLGHTNQQPYLALNFCIALQGLFPSRN